MSALLELPLTLPLVYAAGMNTALARHSIIVASVQQQPRTGGG